MYPVPDRSQYQPNFSKTAEDDTVDIEWAEGVFSDGRPFRVECWAQDQVTHLSCVFSVIGLEDISEGEIQNLLEREGVVRFLTEKRFAGGRMWDDWSGQKMWSVGIVIGDDETLYADCDLPLQSYRISDAGA